MILQIRLMSCGGFEPIRSGDYDIVVLYNITTMRLPILVLGIHEKLVPRCTLCVMNALGSVAFVVHLTI